MSLECLNRALCERNESNYKEFKSFYGNKNRKITTLDPQLLCLKNSVSHS